MRPAYDAIKDWFLWFHQRHEAGLVGRAIATGFGSLDRAAGGLAPGSLTAIVGPRRSGKSTFAWQAAAGAAAAARTTASVIFSSHIPTSRVVQSLLVARARVGRVAIDERPTTTDEWDAMVIAADELSQLALYIDDAPLQGLDDLVERVREVQAREHARQRQELLVVVDDLHPLLRSRSESSLLGQLRLVADSLQAAVLVVVPMTEEPVVNVDVVVKLARTHVTGGCASCYRMPSGEELPIAVRRSELGMGFVDGGGEHASLW